MKAKFLNQLLKNYDSPQPQFKSIQVTGITSDSRKVKPGFIFVALPKAQENSHDGHQFISRAISNQAAAIIIEKNQVQNLHTSTPIIPVTSTRRSIAHLAENFYDNPSHKIKLIGITGTNGKTSTSYFLHSILKNSGYKTRLMGTLGIGKPKNLRPTNLTTLEPENLSAHLYNFVAQNITHVILEVSSHGLALGRVDGLNFGICALSNITQDHLDFHKTLQEYKKAKLRLFTDLANSHTKIVLPNNHDFCSKITHRQNLLTWGNSDTSVVRYKILPELSLRNMFILSIGQQEAQIKLPTFTNFHVENATLSAAIAHSMGINFENIIYGLTKALLPPGRMQQIANPHGARVFVDYAHTPDGLKRALTEIKILNPKKLLLVFGCGGDRDKQKRPLMGNIAQQYSDVQILCDDNPRSENPEKIRQEILSGMNTKLSQANILNIPDRKQAINTALKKSNNQDIILIAGKGHEEKQIFNNTAQDFCDIDITQELIKNRQDYA